jgi:hypothetical protein
VSSLPETLPVSPNPSISANPESYLGRILAGRYVLERLLGKGGMGLVFEARHVTLGRRVAVKVLRPEYARDDEAVARFHREARAAALAGSPHIVEVIDFGFSEEGGAYLAMELLDGEDLATIVRREGALAPARAVAIVRQVAEALAAAHARGIVHRDLKSGNVFVTPGDRVKVLDFGVSKVLDVGGGASFDTAQGTVVGTAHYMAPEQAHDGRGVDARADLYSLGCILFEVLTGTLPFEGASPVEVLYKQVHESPRRPSSVRSGVPQALDGLVLKLLSKDREHRPRDARAVLEALDQWEKRPPWQRHTVIAAALCVGAVAVAFGATSSRFAPQPPPGPPHAASNAAVLRPARDGPDGRSVVVGPDVSGEPPPDVRPLVVATLVLQPERARVTVDGTLVPVQNGVAVLRAVSGSTLTLRAEAPGYLSREQRLTFVEDVALRWSLTAIERSLPESGARGRSTPRTDASQDAGRASVSSEALSPLLQAPPDGLKASPYRNLARP